jgi:hypothetical protein
VTQPSLLFDGLAEPRRHKRQRQTARTVYHHQRAVDERKRQAGQETREGQVLRCLGWHWNVTQTSPTARELAAWMARQGEPVDDINSVRPRLTALVEAGLVETAGKRRCKVSGKTVLTWRVVQR